MVVIGLLLVAAGVLAVVAAVFGTSGSASFLGTHLGAGTIFFLGVGATVAVMCGLGLARAGTGRALRHRREHRRLRVLERERRRQGDPEDHRDEEPGHQDPED